MKREMKELKKQEELIMKEFPRPQIQIRSKEEPD